MGSDGAEDGTSMNVEEAFLAKRGTKTEKIVFGNTPQLGTTIDQDGIENDSNPSAAALTSTPIPIIATSNLIKEMRQDIPTNFEQVAQTTSRDGVTSNATSMNQIADNVATLSTNADEQPELDVGEDYGDEDGGVIRCICECDDDDGFTIQCDRCLVWQHCACFGMSQASVPEEYHCEQCNPRPVDVEFAKAHQQKRKETEARKASIERSIRRHNQNAAAMSTSSSASAGNDVNQSGMLMDGDAKATQSGQGGISRSRKPSQQLDLTNVNFPPVDGTSSVAATPGSARSYKRRGGAPKTGPRKSSIVESPASNSTTPRTVAMMSSIGNIHGLSTPAVGRADDRMDLDEISAERIEAWQVEYTPTSINFIAEESVLASLTSVMADYERDSPVKAERGAGNRVIAPVIGRKVKVLSQMNSSININAVKEPSTGHSKAEHGLTPIGNECIPVEIDTSSLSDCTQRTYVKLISEMASASIFNSLLQVTPLPSEPQRPWSANRVFSKPVMHGFFADVSVPAGCFISEYIGEIASADTYRRDPLNQYQSIGTTKPGVHLFPPPLNLCIDSRRFGNTSRFARFSCHPNAVLRPILLKPSRESLDDSEKETAKSNVVQFGLFAITDIPRTHEITLGWEWDDSHIVHLLPLLVRDPMLGMLQPMRPLSKVTHSSGNQRLLERERRHVAIAALVEKGDFPYAGLLFSQKMNSILTVLLGSCLCACIGSAPASGNSSGGGGQGGNSTASSNNMKRQDCAIAQMLRLSQGMSLLNVYVPGSSNVSGNRRSKIKAPDFEPLVGKRRWWRPNAMPLTPTSLPDDQRDGLDIDNVEDDFYRNLRVPYKLLPGGKVGRVEESDFDSAMERDKVELQRKRDVIMQEDDEESEEEEDDDGDDSDDSALTVPLGRDSELDDDVEDDSLLLQDDNVTIAKGEGGASYLIRTALPPKKRVSGTRLKAVNSAEDDSDVEFKGRKKARDGQKGKKGSRTKATLSTVGKKKKKAFEPSSPLTSAPSQRNSDESDESQEEESQDDTPTPQQQIRHRKAIKREGSNEMEGGAEVKRRKKIDMEARKKALLAKKRRRELMGDLDNESETSSGNEESHIEVEIPQERRPTSSPSKKQARKKAIRQVLQSDESEVEKEQVEEQNSEQRDKTPMTEEVAPISVPEVVTPIVAPPPVIEVPKAKLSLAEYKKRLAERRTTSMNSQSNLSTPLSTPGIVMASPEKSSLPNTPSSIPIPASTSIGQTGYAFPVSSYVSEPTMMVTTPTIIKSEFAPPAPRFPRPLTPPRDAAAIPLSVPRRIGAGAAASIGEISPVNSRTAEAEDLSVSIADQYASAPPLVSPSRLNALDLEKRSSPHTTLAMVTSEKTLSSPTASIHHPMDLDSTSAPQVEEKMSSNLHPGSVVATMQDAKATEVPSTSSASVPVTGRPDRAYSLSKSTDDFPAASITTAKAASGAQFNPPKAPRAYTNQAAVPGSASNATSPPVGPIRSSAIIPSVNSYDARHQRQTSSYHDGAPSSLSLRHPSPSRQPTPLVSPSTTIGSPYTSTYTAGSLNGPASLNDFANVPKGPARMREREREREREIRDLRDRDRIEEREYREPIPPPRDWELQRDREWEREREREYLERDLRDAAYRRDRSHSFDRRRLEDEDDRMEFTPTRSVPPFVPRGGGSVSSRGGFSAGRGIAPWAAGRARTRGRGSRGAWR